MNEREQLISSMNAMLEKKQYIDALVAELMINFDDELDELLD